MKHLFTKENLAAYRCFMKSEEKSQMTIDKYLRDIKKLARFVGEAEEISKDQMVRFKDGLKEVYKVSSVNSILAAVNHFMKWSGYPELTLKSLKCQRTLFYAEERELSAAEYRRLINAAKRDKDEKMMLIMQTIGSTGIRVGELSAVTVSSLFTGRAVISCKNKTRTILLPESLRRILKRYVSRQGIEKGPVFLSDHNKPIHRSYVWSCMKRICRQTDINPDKVFPHNLRHLFARTYYKKQRDIVSLADILGHSNIETTRIYTMTTEREHCRQIECMGLVVG